MISIHALLAESDPRGCPASSPRPYFYPRSPCGERPYGRINDISRLIFLSTLSLRRATQAKQTCREKTSISIHALLAESDAVQNTEINKLNDFYPRSPCGERPPLTSRAKTILAISIHALLAESDVVAKRTTDMRPLFLSTLSLRRATDDILAGVNELLISIHALLAESDNNNNYVVTRGNEFLSTLSLRRATCCVRCRYWA